MLELHKNLDSVQGYFAAMCYQTSALRTERITFP